MFGLFLDLQLHFLYLRKAKIPSIFVIALYFPIFQSVYLWYPFDWVDNKENPGFAKKNN